MATMSPSAWAVVKCSSLQKHSTALKNGEFPDPKLVVDAYLSLAESDPGTRPMRTQVGVSWGVDELNRISQPIQDNILEGLQIAEYLGGVSK